MYLYVYIHIYIYIHMKTEFQNSIVRSDFLYHITGIKIAWINPCTCIMDLCNLGNYVQTYIH